MNVLVGCEFSGVVRNAFRAAGHNAFSCDVIASLDDSPYHIQGDVREQLGQGWDLGIFHPPCTHLSSSGARWFKNKVKEQGEAIEFVQTLWMAPITRICIENPIGVLSNVIGKPTQIVQPYWFGDSFKKSTCLWLRGLPSLRITNLVSEGEFHITKSGKKIPKWYNLPPSPDRGKKRSITFKGMAEAMASQWGDLG